MKWAKRKQAGAKALEQMWTGSEVLLIALVGKARFAGIAGRVAAIVGKGGVSAVMTVAAKLGRDQLAKLNAEARQKHDRLVEVLTRFALDLDDGEAAGVLLRSRR